MEPFDLPQMKPNFRRLAEEHGLGTVFRIWDGVLEAGYGRTTTTEKSLLIFTVSDAAFLDLVASHRGCYHGCPGSSRPDVDPFLLDPLLQRLVVACQIAAGDGTPEPKDGVDVATVGGRTIRLTEDADGTLCANGVKIVQVLASDDGSGSTLYVMEKILWIRPEDVEVGIVRLTENVPRQTPSTAIN